MAYIPASSLIAFPCLPAIFQPSPFNRLFGFLHFQIWIRAGQSRRHQQGSLRRPGRGRAVRRQGRRLHLPGLQTWNHYRAVPGIVLVQPFFLSLRIVL